MRCLVGITLLAFVALSTGPQQAIAFAPCASLGVAIGATCPVECGNAYEQCGGSGWGGTKCCKPGLTCVVNTPTYSQCKPESPPQPTTCSAPFKQCGGSGYTGPKCCTTGYVCEQQIVENQFYSQCVASPESGCPCANNKGYCKKGSGKRTCTACAGVATANEALECCPRPAVGYVPSQGATAGNGPMWELPPTLDATGRTYLVCNWKTLTPSAKWSSTISACATDEFLSGQHTQQLTTAPYVGFRFCPVNNGYLHATTAGLDTGKDPMIGIERESDNKCMIFDDDSGGTLSSTVGLAVVKGQCYKVHLLSWRTTEKPAGIKIWFDQTAPAPLNTASRVAPPKKTP